jgi:hypothetical protein
MLKTTTIQLGGKDAGASIVIRELPALVADRHALAALDAIGVEERTGVVGLTFSHLRKVRALGPSSNDFLQPFVDVVDGPAIRDWRNIARVQEGALMLHAAFIIKRPKLPVPVAYIAESLMHGGDDDDVAVSFCSPMLAGVIDSNLALYRALETELSTEDCFNMAEILNVRALREWRAYQATKTD